MMIIKKRCVYTVLLASLMCSLGCSHSGAKSEGVRYSKLFSYSDIKSEFQITIDNRWELFEIVKTPYEEEIDAQSDLQPERLMIFRSDEDCMISVFVDLQNGVLYYNSDQRRVKTEDQHWVVHHSLFNMDVYSSDNDFLALSDAFLWGEYPVHIIIAGSCNMPRDELEALVLSIRFESQ